MDKITAIVLSVIFIFGIIVCAACSKAIVAEDATTEIVETTEVIEVETSEGETLETETVIEEETILEETSVDTIPETSFEDIAEAIG